jgi:hypothetical protein
MPAGHTLAPKPCVSWLSVLTSLQALTLTDSPYLMHSEPTGETPSAAERGRNPLRAALAAMPLLTKLRLGHSARLSSLAAAPEEPSHAVPAGELRGVREVYAALQGLDLVDLTLDCHPLFGAHDLAAVVCNRGLKVRSRQASPTFMRLCTLTLWSRNVASALESRQDMPHSGWDQCVCAGSATARFQHMRAAGAHRPLGPALPLPPPPRPHLPC